MRRENPAKTGFTELVAGTPIRSVVHFARLKVRGQRGLQHHAVLGCLTDFAGDIGQAVDNEIVGKQLFLLADRDLFCAAFAQISENNKSHAQG